MYWDYDAIASIYKGWSLTEIKSMPVRERRFWKQMAALRRRNDGR